MSVESRSDHTSKELNIESTDSESIDRVYRNTCEESDVEVGIAEGTTTFYKKVTLTRADGSFFPERTFGVSPDRTTVIAWLICERYYNSMIPCER